MNAAATLARKYGRRLLTSSHYGRSVGSTPTSWCDCGKHHHCFSSQRYLFSTKSEDDDSNSNSSTPKEHASKSDSTASASGRRLSQHTLPRGESWKELRKLMGEPLQKPAGPLLGNSDIYHSDDEDDNHIKKTYIPEVSLYEGEGRTKKRILVLCTGGTLTMAPDPKQGGALAPVEGAISKYMSKMEELNSPDLPFEYHLHEYFPFRDSSDLGPADWATLAQDIKVGICYVCGASTRSGHSPNTLFVSPLSSQTICILMALLY
jgi:Asparaginase, N-terminal